MTKSKFLLRIDPALKVVLEYLAEINHRSLTEQINFYLERQAKIDLKSANLTVPEVLARDSSERLKNGG